VIKDLKTLKKAWFCTIICAMFVISLSLGVVFGFNNSLLPESSQTEIAEPDEVETKASSFSVDSSKLSGYTDDNIYYINFIVLDGTNVGYFSGLDDDGNFSSFKIKATVYKVTFGVLTSYFKKVIIYKKSGSVFKTYREKEESINSLSFSEGYKSILKFNHNLLIVVSDEVTIKVDRAKLFKGFTEVKTISGLDSVTLSGTSCESMFESCSSLTTVNAGFSTGNITTMKNMFSGCSALKILNLTSFSTSNVVTMENMFSGCSALTKIEANGTQWTNSKITNKQESVFSGCEKLSAPFTKFDSNKVTAGMAVIDMYDYHTHGYLTPTSSNPVYVDTPIAPVQTTFTYDGSAKTLVPTNWENIKEICEMSTNTRTNAGTTTVSFTLKTGYRWREYNTTDEKKYTIDLVINPIAVDAPEWGTMEITYDGYSHTYQPTNWTDIKSYCKISGNTGKIKAGSYTIKISLNDNTNYVWTTGGNAVKSNTFTIKPIYVKKPEMTDKTFTYDGSKKTNYPSNWNSIKSYCNISNAEKYNAGTYQVIVKLIDTTNYKWEDGSNSSCYCWLTINHIIVDDPECSDVSVTYDGQEHSISVSNWNQIKNYCYISDNNYITNAGNKVVYVCLNDKANYRWKSGDSYDRGYNLGVRPFYVDDPIFTDGRMVTKYTASEVVCEPLNWENIKQYCNISNNVQTAVGTYTVKIEFKDKTGNYHWKTAMNAGDKNILFIIYDCWEGYADEDFDGAGTETNPYKISSATELAGLAKLVNKQVSNPTSYKYYVLTENIDLSGKEWNPIGVDYNQKKYFYGSFDGNGYEISGMTIMVSTPNLGNGLFGFANNSGTKSKISNINMKNSVIDIENNSIEEVYVGGVIAGAQYCDLDNCSYEGSIKYKSSSIDKCNIGGITSNLQNASIINSKHNGEIKLETTKQGSVANAIAGVVAVAENSNVQNCFNLGTITANAINTNIGGIVANMSVAQITSCANYADMSIENVGGGYIAGISAYTSDSSSSVSECMNFGDINAQKTNTGNATTLTVAGICANINKELNNCAINCNIYVTNGTANAIANRACTTYYAYWNSAKGYNGTFDPEVWFISSGINGGRPVLKSLYWIGSGYNNTATEFNNVFKTYTKMQSVNLSK